MTQGQEMTRFGTMVALIVIALFVNNAEAGGRKGCGFFGGGGCGFFSCFSSCGKQQNCAPVCHQPVQSGCPTGNCSIGFSASLGCRTGNCPVPTSTPTPVLYPNQTSQPTLTPSPSQPTPVLAPSSQPNTISINGVIYIRQK